MPENLPILSLITFAPLVGAFLVLLLPGGRGNWLRGTAIAFTVIPLLLTLWLYASYQPAAGGGAFEERLTWLAIPLNIEGLGGGIASLKLSFEYHLSVDGISMPLLLLTSIVSTMSALASVHIRKRRKTYYALFLLLLTGIYGVFLARDLVLFFIFFEVTLIPMFFLIGIWGYYGREKAATRFLVYNGLGSAAMLLAFLLLVATLGFSSVDGMNWTFSGNYDTLLNNLGDANAFANTDTEQMKYYGWFLSENMRWAAFLLLLVAFGIKVPIFPFHTWMLKVHTEAPPAVVMIHSGILLKMGVYGLIRFALHLFPEQAHSWTTVFAVLGVVNILYGAILACVQTEFKLVLAYSSISHMGIVLLGIASLGEVGLQGAIFQSVSHGLISALLFLVVGSIYERTGTTELGELGGLAKAMPFMSGILLLAGLASLGLPGLSGFVGEFLSFLGLFGSMKALTAVGVLGILFAAIYVLRSVLSITYGEMPEKYSGLKDARFVEALPMVALSALIVLLGVYPSLLTDLMQNGFGGLLEQLQTRVGG
ncbi:complex I subunit 4 family protein [Cohnella hongkongensis]|uniref:NuoM family protein n=1 Tax=Cohnella hongkongensis TaxID=178337 RepID=A0ABV9FEV6_9BACL